MIPYADYMLSRPETTLEWFLEYQNYIECSYGIRLYNFPQVFHEEGGKFPERINEVMNNKKLLLL